MVPFWVLSVIRHLVSRGTIILTTTHIPTWVLVFDKALKDLAQMQGPYQRVTRWYTKGFGDGSYNIHRGSIMEGGSLRAFGAVEASNASEPWHLLRTPEQVGPSRALQNKGRPLWR